MGFTSRIDRIESAGMENSELTPMMRQYRDIKAANQDTVLFFRMGDFYEMFYEDAQRVAPLLNITLTSRDRNSPQPVPMCGVPHHSAQQYIAKLVEQGLRVAICEQVEDPKTTKGLLRREVVQVITPATLSAYVDSEAVSHAVPHYLATIRQQQQQWGCALADIATGSFRLTWGATLAELLDELASYQPREVILIEAATTPEFITALQERAWPWRIEASMGFTKAYEFLLEHCQTRSLLGFGLDTERAEHQLMLESAAVLLRYLQQTQRQSLSHLRQLQVYQRGHYMLLDETTRRNLELSETTPHGGASLWQLLNRCQTVMGERELRHWLHKPLLDIASITARQQAITSMTAEPQRLQTLRQHLANVRDLQRLAAKLALGRLRPRECWALADSLQQIPAIKASLQTARADLLSRLVEPLDPLPAIVSQIQATLAEAAPATAQELGVIRDGFNAELDSLRDVEKNGKAWLAALETQERQSTGIGNLKVRYNQVFGYYIEVSRSHLKNVPPHYQRQQTLVQAERFFTPELKAFETKILQASERSAQLEQQLYQELLNSLTLVQGRLLALAEAIAQIDVLQSLSWVALEQNYVCPRVDDSLNLHIVQGRHPVVEASLQSSRFVANDVELCGRERQMLLVTGPNMAGKSTYLRQVALISLMAQMGAFVPAKQAHIGLVDRIFTRMGAADNIAMGRSTFMVEMEEAAAILHQATPRSLLILDEIGRGTATHDGLSLAWAMIEYLHEQLPARTLFATHYHELTALAQRLPGLHNVHIAVVEKAGKIIFLHQILPGPAQASYGIKVAALAGLPPDLIRRAEALLQTLPGALPAAPVVENKTTLPDWQVKLAGLNLDEMTPLQALQLLTQWKREIL